MKSSMATWRGSKSMTIRMNMVNLMKTIKTIILKFNKMKMKLKSKFEFKMIIEIFILLAIFTQFELPFGTEIVSLFLLNFTRRQNHAFKYHQSNKNKMSEK